MPEFNPRELFSTQDDQYNISIGFTYSGKGLRASERVVDFRECIELLLSDTVVGVSVATECGMLPRPRVDSDSVA